MAQTMTKKLLVTYTEAAEMLSVSERTVRRLADRGDIIRINIGTRCPRIVVDSIVNYIKKTVVFLQHLRYNINQGEYTVRPLSEDEPTSPGTNAIHPWINGRNRPTPRRHTLTQSTSELFTATALPVRATSCCVRRRSVRQLWVVIAATLLTYPSAEFSVNVTEA